MQDQLVANVRTRESAPRAIHERSRNQPAADPAICLCGVPIHALSMQEVVERIEQAVDDGRHLGISVVNVAKLVNMHRDKLLRESVLSGDLILADGMPLVWLSRLRGQPLPERVAGIDLMYRLYELADRRHLRVYLLGATQEIIEKVAAIARERYPGMVIAGYRNGYFSKDEEADIARQIGAADADILLVAMTSPKKEIFMERWGSTVNVAVCHGVGGSFDVMAGFVRRAPGWMQFCGLEWFYRVLQEPRRLWKRYFYTNMAFLRLVARSLLSGHGHSATEPCPWGECRCQEEKKRAWPEQNTPLPNGAALPKPARS